MLFRIAMPLIMMLGPRLLPPLMKYLVLIWRLIFDKRVPIVLRALVPLSLVYFLSPWDLVSDRLRPLGRIDDLLIIGLALLLLLKLSPRHVIREHLGIQAPDQPAQEKDPDKVVDGQSRTVDES